MFDFGISVIYLDAWGYIGWGPPSGYLKSFVLFFFLSFLFFLFFLSFFFSILHFLFFPSLLGAPLAPGPLDIVHPCHPVATPLLRNQASVEVENKWIDCLDVVDEVEWNYIHDVDFKSRSLQSQSCLQTNTL